ncbi:MAG: leucyl aminopeptidase family protein, partial [Nitrospira sp.]
TAVKRVRQTGATSFVTCLHGEDLSKTTTIELAQALVEGAILGTYQFTEYLSEKNAVDKQVARLTLLATNTRQLADLKEGARRGTATAEAAMFVHDLCNHPSNVMTPSRVALEAKTIGHERGVRVKVLERAQVERLGMGAFLGVARGSHEPPKFIILEYHGARRSTKPVVIVGKTITFDTGGISLKPAENMEQMKADMTGGAEVLATVRAAARLRLPIHLVGILPATENMPGGRAIKP